MHAKFQDNKTFGSVEEDLLYIGVAVIITFDICMHITSGQGLVKSFFININLVKLVISCTFPPLNDLVTVFPIKI